MTHARVPASTPIARVSAPTNILLFGEYAILHRGGMGISAAMEPRAHGAIYPTAPASPLVIEGIADKQYRYTPSAPAPASAPAKERDESGKSGVWLRKIIDALLDVIPNGAKLTHAPYRLVVDSSQCFDTRGDKRGFGSSAAVSVLLAAMLGYISNTPRPRPPTRKKIISWALSAHRTVQGGGSGYDIYCSATGGVNLFIGGKQPRQRPLQLPWLSPPAPLALVDSAPPVPSGPAVRAFSQWRTHNPPEWRRWHQQSNACIKRLLASPAWETASPAAHNYRALLVTLGDTIGYPVDVSHLSPALPTHSFCKAVGAGNELAIVIPATPTAAFVDIPGAHPLVISPAGVHWQ